jgi:hypothetical protein
MAWHDCSGRRGGGRSSARGNAAARVLVARDLAGAEPIVAANAQLAFNVAFEKYVTCRVCSGNIDPICVMYVMRVRAIAHLGQSAQAGRSA